MKIVLKQCGEHTVEEAFAGSVHDLLVHLAINPETVLVVRNGELLQLDDVVATTDNLEILSVVSGG